MTGHRLHRTYIKLITLKKKTENGRDRERKRDREVGGDGKKKDKIFHSYIINSLHCHGGLVKLIFLLPMTDLMSSPTLAAEYTNENLSNFDLAA